MAINTSAATAVIHAVGCPLRGDTSVAQPRKWRRLEYYLEYYWVLPCCCPPRPPKVSSSTASPPRYWHISIRSRRKPTAARPPHTYLPPSLLPLAIPRCTLTHRLLFGPVHGPCTRPALSFVGTGYSIRPSGVCTAPVYRYIESAEQCSEAAQNLDLASNATTSIIDVANVTNVPHVSAIELGRPPRPHHQPRVRVLPCPADTRTPWLV